MALEVDDEDDDEDEDSCSDAQGDDEVSHERPCDSEDDACDQEEAPED